MTDEDIDSQTIPSPTRLTTVTQPSLPDSQEWLSHGWEKGAGKGLWRWEGETKERTNKELNKAHLLLELYKGGRASTKEYTDKTYEASMEVEQTAKKSPDRHVLSKQLYE